MFWPCLAALSVCSAEKSLLCSRVAILIQFRHSQEMKQKFLCFKCVYFEVKSVEDNHKAIGDIDSTLGTFLIVESALELRATHRRRVLLNVFGIKV